MFRPAGSRSLWLLFLLALLLAVVSLACRQATPTPGATSPAPTTSPPSATATATATPTAGPTATPTGTTTPSTGPVVWRIGMLSDITTTNIWAVLGPSASVWNAYTQLAQYPVLYRYMDTRLELVPAFAAGPVPGLVQEGGVWTATVELREGATWSDGTPIRAEDVAFTVAVAREFQIPGNWQGFIDPSVLVGAEALDARRVKFSFSRPTLAGWQYGVATMPFVAKHFWEPLVQRARQAGTLDERREALLALVPEGEPVAGPMRLERWERGAFVELRANPRYFFAGSEVTLFADGSYAEEKPGVYRLGEPDAAGDVALRFTRGPHVDAAVFSVYGSQDAAALALRRGDIDYLAHSSGLQPGLVRQLTSSGDVRILSNPPNNIRYLGFNLRRAPMDNAAFRQAVAVLIDKEFVAETVLQGAVTPAYALVPPGNAYWHNPGVAELGKGMSRRERLEEAVRLLKFAGFTWDAEPRWDEEAQAVEAGRGLKLPSGQRVPTLRLLAPSAGFDPFRSTFALFVDRWLREAGIPVELVLTSTRVVNTRMFLEQDYELVIGGWSLTVFPGYLRDFFHSSQTGRGGFNAGGYVNPQFDQRADAFLAAADLETARGHVREMQVLLAEDLPYVVLFTSQIIEPVRSNVELPYQEALGGVQAYLQDVGGPLATVHVD